MGVSSEFRVGFRVCLGAGCAEVWVQGVKGPGPGDRSNKTSPGGRVLGGGGI